MLWHMIHLMWALLIAVALATFTFVFMDAKKLWGWGIILLVLYGIGLAVLWSEYTAYQEREVKSQYNQSIGWPTP